MGKEDEKIGFDGFVPEIIKKQDDNTWSCKPSLTLEDLETFVKSLNISPPDSLQTFEIPATVSFIQSLSCEELMSTCGDNIVWVGGTEAIDLLRKRVEECKIKMNKGE